MKFDDPDMFVWLYLVCLVGIVILIGRRFKNVDLHKFVSRYGDNHPEKKQSFIMLNHTGIFIILGLIFAVVSLAKPQWGFEWRDIKRKGIDIVIAIDASKSMLTGDVKPNRLERTKLAVKDLLKQLKGDRVALVGFAGDAFLLCPLTSDYNGFLMSLNSLTPSSLPRGGTNISAAIEESMKALKDTPTKHKALIMITDGENLEGDPIKIAEKARSKDMRIYTVGIGTKEGDLVQVQNDDGSRDFLRDAQGHVIKSRLNEHLLSRIAKVTEAEYIHAGVVQFGLERLYQKELSRIEKQEFESKREKKYHDRFYIPLFLSFIFIFLELCLKPE